MINLISPIVASGALEFAFKQATIEGKITIGCLVIVSLFSWTVIITKTRQLYLARKMAKKFFTAFRASRDPLDLSRSKQEFEGAPAYEVYYTGAEELDYHMKNNPIQVKGQTKVSHNSFDSVRIALERSVSAEALSLEKGMIVLTTAVAGGPFIGLLGTVWGVMETFSGVARANSASLTAMAPGVAGALIATVIGLMVAIPAMFAYNFMVTSIRAITTELDNFATEYATQIEHKYVDNRPLADEIVDALKGVMIKNDDSRILNREPALEIS
ncbi:MAG: MotA/TolQ/ExbB proton channel [Verrucomicrobiales bacterium]|nr:MotA/TolQ/ExbB proton channel [Verrucomicrobiales bacterium]MDB6129586.1 MotA/TolQ/ExbB proton channel [Verrucomicrobiales bacterium]